MELVSLCDSMEVKRGQGWRKPPIDTVRLLLSWFNLDQDLTLVLFIVSFSSTPSSTGKSFSLNIIGVVGVIFFRTKIDQTNFDVPPHFPPVCKKETHIPINNKLESSQSPSPNRPYFRLISGVHQHQDQASGTTQVGIDRDEPQWLFDILLLDFLKL